jgi:hypothetical protein
MRTIFLSMLTALMLQVTTTVRAQHKVKPFEHLSVSVNAGTLGGGVQIAAPVNQYLSLRTGLMMLKYAYKYEYDGEITINGYGKVPPVEMEAKANLVNGLLLADVFPFRNKRIHVTGGFYVGTSDIVKLSALAAVDPDRIIEVGDIMIKPENGKVAAQLETTAFKPYLGIGFGSSVTKRNRVGFKFELGAMFHGTPKIVATEGVLVDKDEIPNLGAVSDELNDFNKYLKRFSVYPVLNFQLNFRAF